MSENANRPTDAEILAIVPPTAAGIMTYVARNVLAGTPRKEWGAIHSRPYRNLDTAFVRRRLIALERAGKVRRVPSCYATQICWSAVTRLSGPSA